MSLRVLVVDDEKLARARLRTLLCDCTEPRVGHIEEAAHAVEAMQALQREEFDAVMLDVHMPGADGLSVARTIQSLKSPPAIIFVTAHAEHAVNAFDLEATDFLTKPVRLLRLQAALMKVARRINQEPPPPQPEEGLLIQDRGRTERVPVSEVIYLKAELKYITLRTAARSYILDGSLSELEEKYPDHFIRIHRNALVARRSLRALEKHYDAEEGEGWAVKLSGVDEVLTVSRRQLALVRETIAG